MALTSLVAAVSAYFADHGVPATAVYGERARPAQGNSKSGQIGGRVSFLVTGKGKYQGPTWLGPREAGAQLSKPRLIALVNDVREKRLAHWATAGAVHLAAEVPATPAPATTLSEALDLGNALRLLELAHHASTTAHQAADTSHTITAPAASSAATLRTLARQLQELGNAHDRDTAAHGAADEAHDSEAADPVEAATKTRAIAQWVPEVSVEIWAWDDTHPSDDAAQMDAWLVLQDWTWNAVRSYGRGVHKLDRTEPATEVVHVRRGFALVAFLTLPIPVHELPAAEPVEVRAAIATSLIRPQGTTPEGDPIPEVETPVWSGTAPAP